MTDTLLLTAAKALKLDDDIALLKALGETIAHWAELAAELDDYASAEALLNAILEGVNGDKIDAAFETVGLSGTLADIRRLLGRVATGAGKIPPEVRKLLSRLDSFAVGSTQGELDWTLATSDEPVVETDRYGLDLGGDVGIIFDAGAAWPGDAPSTRRLRLSAHGGARAGAKASAPYVALSGNATATLDLDYYFAAKPDELFALAVARRLGDLADPFSLDSVWRAFKSSDLDGVRYVFGGAANASLKVAFADAQALSRGIKIDASFTIDVSASLESRYELALRRTDDGLTAKLSRERVGETKFADALKVGVDISSLTQPVAKAIERAVKKWNAALATIKPYLSPGTLLRAKAAEWLTPRLEGLIHDPDLRAAAVADMKGALGLSTVDDSDIVQWLGKKVTDAIDRGSVLANGQAGTAVDRAADHLTASIPVLAGQLPTDRLKDLLKQLIGDIEADLTEKVTALFGDVGGALGDMLTDAGATINGAIAGPDDALKGVRDLLTRYDAVFQKILKAAQDAAKAKVTARLYREEIRTSGQVVEVAGEFTGLDDPARNVFWALTRGELARLEKLVDGQESAPSFKLDAANSSVKRFSSLKSSEGLEVVFLNVSFEATTKVEIDAEVLVDGLGQVHVDTQANLAKRLSLFSSREVSFVDSYQLVLASLQGEAGGGVSPLEVGVGAAFSDDKLSWKDVSTFIKELDDARLVSSAAVDGVRAAFDLWSPGGGSIRGEIAAALRVKGDGIDKLLRIKNRAAGGLPYADRAEIVGVALAAASRRKAIDRQDFDHGMSLAFGKFRPPPLPSPVRPQDVVLNYWEKIGNLYAAAHDGMPRDYPLPTVFPLEAQEDYEYFVGQGYALRRIPRLIDTMGDIYEARPSVGGGPGWSERDYLDRQEALVNDSKAWLHVFRAVIPSIFSSKITPRTVAFLRILTDLSGRTADNPGGLVLTLTHRPKGLPAQTKSFS